MSYSNYQLNQKINNLQNQFNNNALEEVLSKGNSADISLKIKSITNPLQNFTQLQNNPLTDVGLDIYNESGGVIRQAKSKSSGFF